MAQHLAEHRAKHYYRDMDKQFIHQQTPDWYDDLIPESRRHPTMDHTFTHDPAVASTPEHLEWPSYEELAQSSTKYHEEIIDPWSGEKHLVFKAPSSVEALKEGKWEKPKIKGIQIEPEKTPAQPEKRGPLQPKLPKTKLIKDEQEEMAKWGFQDIEFEVDEPRHDKHHKSRQHKHWDPATEFDMEDWDSSEEEQPLDWGFVDEETQVTPAKLMPKYEQLGPDGQPIHSARVKYPQQTDIHSASTKSSPTGPIHSASQPPAFARPQPGQKPGQPGQEPVHTAYVPRGELRGPSEEEEDKPWKGWKVPAKPLDRKERDQPVPRGAEFGMEPFTGMPTAAQGGQQTTEPSMQQPW